MLSGVYRNGYRAVLHNVLTKSKRIWCQEWMTNCSNLYICLVIQISLLNRFDHEHFILTIIFDIHFSQPVGDFYYFPKMFTWVATPCSSLMNFSIITIDGQTISRSHRDPFHFALIRNYKIITLHLNHTSLWRYSTCFV